MTFCKLLYHRNCKRRGVGGQKKPNLVNVVCERPLIPNHSYKRMQLNWADIFWSVAPILKVKKLSQMQHLPTKKNVIINHYLVQFRFSKKAKKIWKYLPNDFHSEFQIYWEIFLQFLCCLLRKKPELYHCWELFTRSNPKLFWFSKSRNHEFQIFFAVYYCFEPWRKWKIPICIWLIYKKILIKNSDTEFLIENWIQR